MLIVMMLVMAVQAAFQLNYTVLKAQNTSGIYAIRARIQADMAPTLLTFHYALGERFIQLQHPHLFHSAYQVGQVLHLQPTSHHAQTTLTTGLVVEFDLAVMSVFRKMQMTQESGRVKQVRLHFTQRVLGPGTPIPTMHLYDANNQPI